MHKAWFWLSIVCGGVLVAAACDSSDLPPAPCTPGGTGAGDVQSCDLGGDCEACFASECAREVCKDDIAACDANSHCGDFETCISDCADVADPGTCHEKCIEDYGDGIVDLGNKLSCLVCDQSACFKDCNGAQACGSAIGGSPPFGGAPPFGGGAPFGGGPPAGGAGGTGGTMSAGGTGGTMSAGGTGGTGGM